MGIFPEQRREEWDPTNGWESNNFILYIMTKVCGWCVNVYRGEKLFLERSQFTMTSSRRNLSSICSVGLVLIQVKTFFFQLCVFLEEHTFSKCLFLCLVLLVIIFKQFQILARNSSSIYIFFQERSQLYSLIVSSLPTIHFLMQRKKWRWRHLEPRAEQQQKWISLKHSNSLMEKKENPPKET